jgi:hypothetical protein
LRLSRSNAEHALHTCFHWGLLGHAMLHGRMSKVGDVEINEHHTWIEWIDNMYTYVHLFSQFYYIIWISTWRCNSPFYDHYIYVYIILFIIYKYIKKKKQDSITTIDFFTGEIEAIGSLRSVVFGSLQDLQIPQANPISLLNEQAVRDVPATLWPAVGATAP